MEFSFQLHTTLVCREPGGRQRSLRDMPKGAEHNGQSTVELLHAFLGSRFVREAVATAECASLDSQSSSQEKRRAQFIDQ